MFHTRRSRRGGADYLTADNESPAVFWLLLALVTLGLLVSAAPWILRTGSLFLGSGLLVLGFKGRMEMSGPVVFMALVVLFCGLASFLPADRFGIPAWRRELSELGVNTGSMVTIQWRQAIEQYLESGLVLMTGIWIAAQRTSARNLRNVAMAFSCMVALYAVMAFLLRSQLPVRTYDDHFGFFPNRNHSGTLLSMGVVCGAGTALQAMRNKNHLRLGFAVAAVTVCLWAAFVWSISRSGIILSGIGLVGWAVLLGPGYFRAKELKAVALFGLLAVGVYAIADTKVKGRIASTVEKASEAGKESGPETTLEATGAGRYNNVDFRVPIALDTFRMISDSPLAGVGVGQFRHVFPQYRNHSAIGLENEAVHPESSWLWWAAEFGLPATVGLGAITIHLFVFAYRNIKGPNGKERAIRLGCLMAAAIVPIHCFFDVPAHRAPLLWAAALLYALSLNPKAMDGGNPRRLVYSLFLGFGLTAAGLRLLGTGWWDLDQPFSTAGRESLRNGAELYENLFTLQGRDRFQALEARIRLADLATKAAEISPLEHKLYSLRALSLLPIERQEDTVQRCYRIERKLIPFSIKVPMSQALALSPFNKNLAIELWAEALDTATLADSKTTGTTGLRKNVLRKIELSVKKDPELSTLWDDEFGSYRVSR